MSTKHYKSSANLVGHVPDPSPFALLIIDAINDFDFVGGRQLLRRALTAAPRIAALKTRLQRRGVPVIYANDNFGRWRSSFSRVVGHCLKESSRGRPVVEMLRPGPDDYFVLKPRNSAFLDTPLEILLDHLGTRRVILTGFATEACVLATAMDAHACAFELTIPADCVASGSASGASALKIMRKVLRARTPASAALDLRSLQRTDARTPGSKRHVSKISLS